MQPSWEIRLEILSQWQSGRTQAEIAREYGLSVSRVSQICLDTKLKIAKNWEPKTENSPVLSKPQGRPSEGKQKKSVSFDPDVWEIVKDMEWRSRSKFINGAIREKLAKNKHQERQT